MDMDKEYDRICKKLGFIPKEYKDNCEAAENDNWKNPFLILTDEEIDFLHENGYLN